MHWVQTHHRVRVFIYLYACICTAAQVDNLWWPFSGSLVQFCTKLYENCANPDVPILLFKPGYSYIWMKTLVLLYLYVHSIATIPVCRSGNPIPICKPECSYISMETRMPLYLHASLGALTHVCKSWCSYTCTQAQLLIYSYVNLGALIPLRNPGAPIHVCKLECPLYFYASPNAPIPVCKPRCPVTYVTLGVVPVCKLVCSYISIQARMPLYLYTSLDAP